MAQKQGLWKLLQPVKSEAKKIDGAAPSAYGSGGLAGRQNTLRAQKDVSASNPGILGHKICPLSNKIRTRICLLPRITVPFPLSGTRSILRTGVCRRVGRRIK